MPLLDQVPAFVAGIAVEAFNADVFRNMGTQAARVPGRAEAGLLFPIRFAAEMHGFPNFRFILEHVEGRRGIPARHANGLAPDFHPIRIRGGIRGRIRVGARGFEQGGGESVAEHAPGGRH